MKQLINNCFLAIALLTSLTIQAQLGGFEASPEDLVQWEFTTKDKVGDRYEIQFKATIEEGWHLYSHFIEDGGPVPTTFEYEENGDVSIKDKLKEKGKRIEKYDETFSMDLAWFEKEAVFTQKVKLKDGVAGTLLKGEVMYMICDDEKCLPPTYQSFVFALGDAKLPTMPVESEDYLTGGETEEKAEWFYRVTEEDELLKVEWKVKLADEWQIYSQHLDEGGPIPTEFIFEESKSFETVGEVSEDGELIKKNDPLFDNMEVLSYKDEVVFAQKLKWTDERDPIVGGEIMYMTCDKEACVFGGADFKVDLTKRNEWLPVAEPIVTITEPDGENTFNWEKVVACDDDGEQQVIGEPKYETEKGKGNWLIFILGFGGGLFALLTPCVFPMIPLTVSFFTKKGQKRSVGIRNAFIYGFSIIFLYVALGTLVTAVFGADALNAMAASPVMNVIFFVLFVVFAISFFGFFEITLPSSWSNKADQEASKGGLMGIVFMAFTLALVSFSCTGPIIGSLLVEGATGDSATILNRIPVRPLVGMFGFGLALALPFTLFALFPSWLNSLPQSGGWLNTVKVFLGFLELAFALKFLSVADLAGNWNILKIEPFLIIWMLIFLGLAAYMFGLIKFPHDSSNSKITLPKGAIGLLSLAFAIYLATGIGNPNPRKLLSGLAPPAHYSYLNPKKCPADLDICFKDFDAGMKYAKRQNMPVLIDFTGNACVNCRKMEENVWTVGEVNDELKKFVLISLYVDDTKKLKKEDVYTSTASGRSKKIKTVGNLWSDFQIKNFQRVSQPYYVLVSPNYEVLNSPVAYTPDSDKYLDFLQCGLGNLENICPKCVK